MASEGSGLGLLPGDAVQFERQSIRCFSHREELHGPGTLYISLRNLYWVSASQEVLSWPFKKIIAHAISLDSESFPHPAIYCLIAGDRAEDANDEFHFVPSVASELQELFEKFCDAAALNPDSDQERAEEEGDDDLFFNREEAFTNMIIQSAQNGGGEAMDDVMFASPENSEFAVQELATKRRRTDDPEK